VRRWSGVYVLDTNVLVAGLRSNRGASFALLRAVDEGRLTIAASAALFFEYEAVLLRCVADSSVPLERHLVVQFLNDLAARVRRVRISYAWRPQLSDPDDEHVLECAVNANATALVTFNVADFESAAPRLGVRVFRPRALFRPSGSPNAGGR